jgi:hypothetical protein
MKQKAIFYRGDSKTFDSVTNSFVTIAAIQVCCLYYIKPPDYEVISFSAIVPL